MQNCDILIKNARYLDPDMSIQKNQNIAIKDGKILAIDEGQSDYRAPETIDGRGLLWMPGLVDGHTHTSQQMLRGRLLDEKPVIWKRVNVPFENDLKVDTSTLSAEISALEMIKGGTTGFVDVGGAYAPDFAKVYDTSGLRARLTYFTNDNKFCPDNLRTTPEQAMKRLLELHDTYHEGRIQTYFAVTALTAASAEMINTVFAAAKERGIPTTVHMNEYASEIYDFIEAYGVRPFEYMDAQGLISGNFLAAHCLFLSQREIEIILEHDVRVAHCPFSNCGKGIPNTPELLARGVKVGFGTDGSAHGGMDLFKELRLFRGVMNAHHGVGDADPQVMTAKMLLNMATKGGAATLMAEDELGSIEPGKTADLIALDIDAPHLCPTQNLVNSIVESACGNDVEHSIIDGVLVMKNREVLTLDEERIMYDVRRTIGELGLFQNPDAYWGEEEEATQGSLHII